jgi:hypothetical protein
LGDRVRRLTVEVQPGKVNEIISQEKKKGTKKMGTALAYHIGGMGSIDTHTHTHTPKHTMQPSIILFS